VPDGPPAVSDVPPSAPNAAPHAPRHGAPGRRVRRPDLAPLARNALGGVVAVALVGLGIAALQVVVPEPAQRDGPVVKAPSATTFVVPSQSGPPPVESTSETVHATLGPPRTATPTPAATTSPSPPVAVRPPLTVLNNSRINGLAARAARDFTAGGWRVEATGNLRGRTPRTTVYYAPGYADEAATLRRQFPKVLDALPRPAGLPGGSPLTVVVTRDYAA
jgi:hypothetical protein